MCTFQSPRPTITVLSAMGKLKTTPFIFADYLRTPEDYAGFLTAVIQDWDGNPQVIATALGKIAEAEGIAEVAKRSGLSLESLHKTFSDEQDPSFGTILKVMATLGLQFRVIAR